MTNTITSNPTAEKDLKKDLDNAKTAIENTINEAQENYVSLVEAENSLRNSLNDLPNHYINLKIAANNQDGTMVKAEKDTINKLWHDMSNTIVKHPTAFVNLLNNTTYTHDSKAIPVLKIECKYPELVDAYDNFHNQLDSVSQSSLGKTFAFIKNHMPKIFTSSETEATFFNDTCLKTNNISNIYDNNIEPIITGINKFIEILNDPQKLYILSSASAIHTPVYLSDQTQNPIPEVTCSGQVEGNGECI
ncbi:hypothetical protein NOVO_05665 [Rickettsiales bacterium Ac37b]|nr:hypothetical protein NOVO_05665 [Rickettsiales bacterium Ac37b]